MSLRDEGPLKIYAPYALLALVVLAPLLAPGYILTLDAVFVPHIAAPTMLSNAYLWQMLLHLLNVVVPSQALEKAIFVGIILCSGVAMHQLVVYIQDNIPGREGKGRSWTPYVGGILYTANPFTYDRFMAGQYEVLLGYALLPLALRWLLQLAQKPALREVWRVSLLAAAIGVVSLPTLGEFALLAACVILPSAWQERRDKPALKTYIGLSLAALGIFAALSSYWLIPLLLGKGTTAADIRGFTDVHTAAFATVGGNFAAKLAAVLRLQGFWAEAHQLFVLPQDKLPGWGTVRLLVWSLVALGLTSLWRRSQRIAVILGALLATAALFAAGLFSAALTHIGYREPQKFAGLVALVFAVGVSFGGAAAQRWLAQKKSEAGRAAAPAVVLLVILLFAPTMYWGFAGQLTPRRYPAGWFQAAQYLSQQQGTFRTIFLPWHQYMSFAFAGRIIAAPGAKFFAGQTGQEQDVIVSNDPEIGRIQPSAGQETTQIGRLVTPTASYGDLAAQLSAHNIRYIILAKDYDFQKYAYLSQTPHITLVEDTVSIAVYQNQTWQNRGGQ